MFDPGNHGFLGGAASSVMAVAGGVLLGRMLGDLTRTDRPSELWTDSSSSPRSTSSFELWPTSSDDTGPSESSDDDSDSDSGDSGGDSDSGDSSSDC